AGGGVAAGQILVFFVLLGHRYALSQGVLAEWRWVGGGVVAGINTGVFRLLLSYAKVQNNGAYLQIFKENKTVKDCQQL
ncbi:MAG: hypothetical protein K5893_07210, partial [Prevotella sp.]|nr:hypothetical protein [Prevotella sp.]